MLVRLSTLALAASIVGSPSVADALSASDIPADTPISSLLSSAQSHIARGETSDALLYYDAALVRDSSDYLTYFKRATTLLTMGRMSQATEDFNKVVALKPGFEGAHVQLGRIKLRSADWEGAQAQYKLANKSDGSPEMEEIAEARAASGLAETAEKKGDMDECVKQADTAINAASRSLPLRELRSRCRLERGDFQEAMADLQHVLQLSPGDVTPHLKISAITFYALGELQSGLTKIRKCFHSDPESKVCKKMMKNEKAVEKTMAKVEEAFKRNTPLTGTKLLVPSADSEGLLKEVQDQVVALREDGTIPKNAPNLLEDRIYEMACEGYMMMNSKKAADYCPIALRQNEDSFFGLWHKGKVAFEGEQYESAVTFLRKAGEIRPDKRQQIQQLLQNAELELKRSKTKDYYKVIGVSRDADEKQIKAAYRRLSKLHHPDKAVQQGLTKEEAEKKMAQINEAYEVLSDSELRARFDRGDDPNSQEQQQNPFQGSPFGGGHPFFQQGGQQGGFPGGFQFHFGGGRSG